MNIPQFIIDENSVPQNPISIKLRLGMFVEQCVFQSLEKNTNYTVLAKNIQIIENNLTLGELDCIMQNNNSTVHLEIAYKFYLFDKSCSKNELHCWVGPNRKDSLIEKIQKIKEKQFPLLYHAKTLETLNSLNISVNNIEQQVCFKAQLFIPFTATEVNYETINNDCIVGLYYTLSELTNIKLNKFYLPSKLEWAAIPNINVDWMNFEQFLIEIESLLSNMKSPLFWSKDQKGNISKCFAVWW